MTKNEYIDQQIARLTALKVTINAVPVPQDRGKFIDQVAAWAREAGSPDVDLVCRIISCESHFDPSAINVNVGGSIDRGLAQINDKWHPEVTDAQAFDPKFATEFIVRQIGAGMLSDWNSSKTCWTRPVMAL